MGGKSSKKEVFNSNKCPEYRQPENDENYDTTSKTSTDDTFSEFRGTQFSLDGSQSKNNSSKEILCDCGTEKLADEKCWNCSIKVSAPSLTETKTYENSDTENVNENRTCTSNGSINKIVISNLEEDVEKSSETEDIKSFKTIENESKIVIAIDFGTSFTGFAYSYNKQACKGNESIGTGKLVLGENRVPTVVLLKPDKTVDSVGSKAEYEYAKLVIRKNQKDYRLFSRFKMALYMNKDLTTDSTIPDNDGKTMPALELFTIVIRYMKENAIDMMKDSLLGDKSNITESILWVLTIPAIWSYSARQFMHEVLINAGIPEKQFRLVLEPEAAAMYCRNDLLFRSDRCEISMLPTGTKYILADLGGGTVDICSHEIIENNRIREIFRATGGAFGGTFVNDEFIQILIKIFGSDVWRKFQRERFYDYLTLVYEFEKSKTNFGPEETDKVNEVVVIVPNSLESLFKELTKCNIEDIIQQGLYSGSIEFYDGKLIFKRKMMEQFFSKSVQGITSYLKEIINQCKDQDIKSVLLVGGYAESKYVTDKIKQSMKDFDVDVIVVAEPRLSVMKGAVMLGYEDRKIVQRRSRVTYGFKIAKRFIEGVHPEKYKFERDGEYWCNNIFDKLIEKDQYVEHGQEFKTTTHTPRRFQESKTKQVCITVVTSEKCDPTYCSEEEECKEVGEIIIEPPEEGWPDENENEMYLIVQEDIMNCKVIDKTCGGKEYTTQVDFLSKSLKL